MRLGPVYLLGSWLYPFTFTSRCLFRKGGFHAVRCTQSWAESFVFVDGGERGTHVYTAERRRFESLDCPSSMLVRILFISVPGSIIPNDLFFETSPF